MMLKAVVDPPPGPTTTKMGPPGLLQVGCGKIGHHPASCEMAFEYKKCEVHNKVRSRQNLFLDPNLGYMRCLPSSRARHDGALTFSFSHPPFFFSPLCKSQNSLKNENFYYFCI